MSDDAHVPLLPGHRPNGSVLSPTAPASDHTLLVSDRDSHRRQGVARWVGRELAAGSKVVYTGWLPPGATSSEQHWIAGPAGPRDVRAAIASGQFVFVELPTVLEATGGRAGPLLELQGGVAAAAIREGWPRVAMTAESPHRPMGPGEAAELVAHEEGLGALTVDLPLRALCQLSVPEEADAAVWETVGVHHRDVVDEGWSATSEDGMWVPRGELDAHVARRFGAGLHAALTAAEAGSGEVRDRAGDLHVDLGGVAFLDVACARLITLTARAAAEGTRVVLHRPSRTVRRLVDAVEVQGRPRALVWADGEAGPRPSTPGPTTPGPTTPGPTTPTPRAAT